MNFKWHKSKELTLQEKNRPSFESVVEAIVNGGLVDQIDSPVHIEQKILIVKIPGVNHLCAVPVTPTGETYFLHTVYPSAKMTKKYLGDKK